MKLSWDKKSVKVRVWCLDGICRWFWYVISLKGEHTEMLKRARIRKVHTDFFVLWTPLFPWFIFTLSMIWSVYLLCHLVHIFVVLSYRCQRNSYYKLHTVLTFADKIETTWVRPKMKLSQLTSPEIEKPSKRMSLARLIFLWY